MSDGPVDDTVNGETYENIHSENEAEESDAEASGSGSGSGSDSEESSGEETPVEMLVASRSRRATAGNRMRSLLDKAVAEDLVKEGVEDEEDVEFVDNDTGKKENEFDSDFESTDSEGEEEDAGETQLQEEEREERRAQQKKKRTRGPVLPDLEAPRRTAPRPSRRPPHAPAQPAVPRDTRHSTRRSVAESRSAVATRIEERTSRAESERPKAPPRKRIELTQADRIAEALETEEINIRSLHEFYAMEEERKARDRILAQRPKVIGPRIIYLTSIKRGYVKPVTSVRPDAQKSRRRRRPEKSVQVVQDSESPVPGASNGTSTQEQLQDGSIGFQDPTPETRETPSATEAPKDIDQATGVVQGPEAEVVGEQTDRPAEETAVEAPRETGEPAEVQTQDQVPDQTQNDSEKQIEETIPSHTEGEVTGAFPAVHVAHEDVKHARFEDPPQEDFLASQEDGVANQVPLPAEETYDADKYLNFVIVHETEDAIKTLFGDQWDWEERPKLLERDRIAAKKQRTCPFTGEPARYQDSASHTPYIDRRGYQKIQACLQGEYAFSRATETFTGSADGDLERAIREKVDYILGVNSGAVAPVEVPTVHVAPSKAEPRERQHDNRHHDDRATRRSTRRTRADVDFSESEQLSRRRRL